MALSAELKIYAYDAYVLACAEAQHAPLVTLDRRLVRAAEQAGVDVIEVSHESVYVFRSTPEVRENFGRSAPPGIRRKDCQVFELRPELSDDSPLNVKGVDLGLSRDDIVSLIKTGRKKV